MVEPLTNGAITCTSPVDYYTSATCISAPSFGYHLASLSDNGVSRLDAVVNRIDTIPDMRDHHRISAGFAIDTFSVTTTISGVGQVTSNPPGLNCAGVACSAGYRVGAKVTLLPASLNGSAFSSWSGD